MCFLELWLIEVKEKLCRWEPHKRSASCPMQEALTCCMHMHVVFMHKQENYSFYFFWLGAIGLYFERKLTLKPVKLCQSCACSQRAAILFCVWVNCGSGGIFCASSSEHASTRLFFFFCLLVPIFTFVRFYFCVSKTPTHSDPSCWEQPGSGSCGRLEVLPLDSRICVLIHANESRSFGASLLLKHSCCHCFSCTKQCLIVTLSVFIALNITRFNFIILRSFKSGLNKNQFLKLFFFFYLSWV